MSDTTPTKKALGQHWLHDQAALAAMTDTVQAGDTVLEIGPGTGELTAVLLERGAHVVAVERDQDLLVQLRARFVDQDFALHHSDILTFDLTTLPSSYKVIANIPYYLTSNLVRVLSESTNPPEQAVLLVQKEVAERLAADAGRLSILAVTAQFYWEVSLGMVVGAELFVPPPKVDSQVVLLQRRSQTMFPDVDAAAFFWLVKAGFSSRRKTLLNSLSGGLRLNKQQAQELLGRAQIAPTLRPQALTLDQWHDLYLAYRVS